MKLVILAGGYGTRLGEIAKTEKAMRNIGSENLEKLGVFIKTRLEEKDNNRITKSGSYLC